MKYWIGSKFIEEMMRNPKGWWWKRRVSKLKSKLKSIIRSLSDWMIYKPWPFSGRGDIGDWLPKKTGEMNVKLTFRHLLYKLYWFLDG